jgi:threonine dehydratase
MPAVVDRAAVAEARRALDGIAFVTPLEYSRALSDLVGGPVHLKCENLQRTGSFKIRGAYVRMSRLTPQQRSRGVVAASAGNHAQGVALAAQLLGISAVVYMPTDVALPKLEATQNYGAQVRLWGATVDEALREARAVAERTGRTLIHPFDHPDIVAGQGTIGLEILDRVPDVRTVLVPTGGGGLVAGIAAALAGEDVRVIGVQASAAAAYPASLAAGRPTSLAKMSTIADGIAVGKPGEVPFAIVRQSVAEIRTVSEEQISRGLLAVVERSKLVVEPSAAVGVAALLETPTAFTPPVVVVLSGGNVDTLLLLNVLRHGLSVAGRFLLLRVRIPDRPGSLATLLGHLAATGANVVTIGHVRTGLELLVGEVEIEAELETKGPHHCDAVLARLASAGYDVRRP